MPTVQALDTAPAVALLGPRQVGKITLAHEIAETRPSIYLDLKTASDRARFTDPEAYLAAHEDELVILDEVHRVPELFQQLRGLGERGRRRGKIAGRLLLLGSASWICSNSRARHWLNRDRLSRARTVRRARTPADSLDTLWAPGAFPRFSWLPATRPASVGGKNRIHIDPIKALFWSAVINDVAAVPIMVMIRLPGSRSSIMGRFPLPPVLKTVGWIATAVMAAAAVGMFATIGA
jgi:hypothetical protein